MTISEGAAISEIQILADFFVDDVEQVNLETGMDGNCVHDELPNVDDAHADSHGHW